jgi:predicted RNase H-like HicB family nuclease
VLARLAIGALQNGTRKGDVQSGIVFNHIERCVSRELLIREAPLILARPLHVDRDMNRFRRTKLRNGGAHVIHDIRAGIQRQKQKDRSGKASHGRKVCRKLSLVTQTFTAVYEPAEEGGYAAFVEEVPGAISQGETLEEARENLKDALELMLEVNRENALDGVDENRIVREPITVIR